MKEQMTWIDATERRPEPPCIIFDANGNTPKSVRSILSLTDKEHGEFHLSGDDWDFNIRGLSMIANYNNRITHWMPLPEPPGGWYDEETKESNVFHNATRYKP